MIKFMALSLLWQFIIAGIPIPPENYYNQGNRYYSEGQYLKAEAAWRDSLKGGHLQQKAYYNAGNAAYWQKKYQKAIAYYEKALDLDPHDEDAWYNLELARRKVVKQVKQIKKSNQDIVKNARPELSGRHAKGTSSSLTCQVRKITETDADQILAQSREQEQYLQPFQKSRFTPQPSSEQQDIFTQSPEEILQTMRELTKAVYPFQPGYSLKKNKAQKDSVDW